MTSKKKKKNPGTFIFKSVGGSFIHQSDPWTLHLKCLASKFWQVHLTFNNQNYNPLFQVPASKKHTYSTIKSSIYFLHCLTKGPVERKLLSKMECQHTFEKKILQVIYLSWQTLMPLTTHLAMSQPCRVNTKRKLQTAEWSKDKLLER